jgi:hypothetical protein
MTYNGGLIDSRATVAMDAIFQVLNHINASGIQTVPAAALFTYGDPRASDDDDA